MKITLGVITGVFAALILSVALAFAQQTGEEQGGMMDQQPMEQQPMDQALKEDPQSVMQIEQALSAQGYNPGVVDGQWTSESDSALKQFQQAQGMDATGQLDDQTLASLGFERAAGGQQDMSGQYGEMPDQGAPGGQQETMPDSGAGAPQGGGY